MTEVEWRWEPVQLDEAVGLMAGFPGPWWIAAGWAIELHLGRRVREHRDVDVLVLRDDQAAIRPQPARVGRPDRARRAPRAVAGRRPHRAAAVRALGPKGS